MEQKINHSVKGLNLDSVNWQLSPGELSFAMNAGIQSQDGNRFTYTNEPSNQLCVDLSTIRPGFKVVGFRNIIELNKIIVFITHPDGRSEIGEITNYNKDCLTSDPTEEDCGCAKGIILKDTVASSGACCNYNPILTDDCCSSCDSDCYIYAVENPGIQIGEFIWVDCCTGEQKRESLFNGQYIQAKRGSVIASLNSKAVELQKSTTECPCNFSKDNCCLNFSIDYPVFATYKITNKGVDIYFVSKNNPIRTIRLTDPLGLDACGDPIECLPSSCGRINVFPKTCQPNVLPTILTSGGQLKAGTYQFAIAYADYYGNELTDYFDLTNPVSVFERQITNDTDYITSKSIRLNVKHETDIFTHYNIAVAETVNGTTLYYLIETRQVKDETFTYTGNHKEEYSSYRVLTKTPYYESANIIESSGDILFLADLETTPEYNLQPLTNQLILKWETVKMPADKPEFNYANGVIDAHFRTYQRDEVYPWGIKYHLTNGKTTRVFHIPGREATGPDLALLAPDGKDIFNSAENCPPNDPLPTWKVYNTASTSNLPPKCYEFDILAREFDCEINPYSAGEFAYWESTETYPCNEEIWGELSGRPIRFHKFPDCKISPIHSPNGDPYIFPIGVRLDVDQFNNLLNHFEIKDPKTNQTVLLKDIICGFELVRGNRVGNKSVIAKGLTYDVCKFSDNERSYYYSNYPFNDLRDDHFLSNSRAIYDSPDPNDNREAELRQRPFYGSSFQRFTFHSPDTHFQFPKLGTELKIESGEFGTWQGHFTQVEEHPRYKFLTRYDLALSAAIGTATAFTTTSQQQDKGTATDPGIINVNSTEYNIAEALSNTSLFKDLIEKSLPHVNYAWQYNSIANYDKSVFPNKGTVRRKLDLSAYLSPNNQHVGDDLAVRNYHKESSVYLKVNDKFSDINPGITDNSRNTLSQINGWCDDPTSPQSGQVKANYCSIKRDFPDQYGPIQNIKYVNTGDRYQIIHNGPTAVLKCKYYPTFGGDTFINKFSLKRKHPFFTQNMVGRPDDVDFDYELVPNIAYPTYYIGTSPDTIRFSDIFTTPAKIELITGFTALLVQSALSAGATVAKVASLIANLGLSLGAATVLVNTLAAFVPKNNLDCDRTLLASGLNASGIGDLIDSLFGQNSQGDTLNPFQQIGKFYLNSYGIPTFFVESDINVDLRHGRDFRWEDFYPHVGTQIPDDWLQEKTVPIQYDNYYSYNTTYSKQNYENYNEPYAPLLPDPITSCQFPNRVIYSDATNQEERKDSWRIFRANNYFDFPKTNGKLISINSIENDKVLARFENTTAVYNARIILDSQHPVQIELGTGAIFSQKPIEYVKADIGYLGTQHKAYLSCKYGSFWTDAKRGFVYMLSSSSGLEEISKTNYNWFKQNLPFAILEDFPTYNIDNAFKDIGISLGWDERYERVFLTKLDYKLLPEFKSEFEIRDNRFYNKVINDYVEPTNGFYFENKSFTIAYSPIIKNWISFYSFLPNAYIAQTNHFQTVTHNGIYNHLLSPLSYQVFYGTLYPYILEYPLNFSPKVQTINSVTLIQDIQKYYNQTDYYSLNSTANDANFTKAILYNKEQCSGLLNLIYQEPDNRRQRSQFPRVNTASIDILYSKRESKYTFNTFPDITSHLSQQPIFTKDWSKLKLQYPMDKVLNDKTLSYSIRQGTKQPLRSKECRIRLIQDKYERYKFINHFAITETNQSTI